MFNKSNNPSVIKWEKKTNRKVDHAVNAEAPT